MLFALALLICWAVAELFVAIQVAHLIGVAATIVLLIVTWPIGTWALRTQGAAAWRRLADAVAAGRAPAREAVDGALVLFGGVLLIVPGFITDVVGAFMLLAPTRALLRPLLLRNAQRRVFVRAAGYARGRNYDVDSTATDIDQPQLRS
jgi:UPF0716 protein FxsA